jgi:hypothetical protein
MALFDKPDLEKLKQEHKYARLIDWANYQKDPAVRRQARQIIEADPAGLAEYLYETVYWTRRNSGHNGRRLPRRGISLIRQATGMAVAVGEPMLEPLAESLRVYAQYGDPDLKTMLLYYSVVFDVLHRMGTVARTTLLSLEREKDPEIKKHARQALKDLPDEEPQWDEWDDWEDDADGDEEEQEDVDAEEDEG